MKVEIKISKKILQEVVPIIRLVSTLIIIIEPSPSRLKEANAEIHKQVLGLSSWTLERE